MIQLTEKQRQKLTELGEALTKKRDRTSYLNCLDYTTNVLKRIYSNGYVVCLELLPELQQCVLALSKFCGFDDEAFFVNSINGLKMQPRSFPITSSNYFEYAYKEAKKKQFCVKDCLPFYFTCDYIGKYFGTTPEETNANFILDRIKKNQKFDFEGYPAPNRESLLIYFVNCAKSGKNPFQITRDNYNPEKLPDSYMFYISKIVAKNEKMTLSEWFKYRIKPLSVGIPTPMPYMLASEKSICSELALPDGSKQYFRKIVHYVSWNNLPRQTIINILPGFAETNNYLQSYKSSAPSNHKLHKPNSYTNNKIRSKISSISRSNANNFVGEKDLFFYNSILFDLRLFAGDSDNYNNASIALSYFIKKYQEKLGKNFNIERFLQKYDNPNTIAARHKFFETNAKKTGLTIKNPEGNIEIQFLKDLKLSFPKGLLPPNFTNSLLGKRAAQIANSKGENLLQYINSIGYEFTDNAQDCLLGEDELLVLIRNEYKTKNIYSSNFRYNKLYQQIKVIAEQKKLTVKQYFALKGYNYIVEKVTKKSYTDEEIIELLRKDFPSGVIANPIVSLPYAKEISKAAIRSRQTASEYLKSNGFSVFRTTRSKTTKCVLNEEILKNQLQTVFKNGIITKEIKSTKLLANIRTFARNNNITVSECIKRLGFVDESGYNSKSLKESEMLDKLSELFPNRVIPKNFEKTLLGQKCKRVAANQNKTVSDYLTEHNFLYAKFTKTDATEEEVLNGLQLNFPDGKITDRQFLKTTLGQNIIRISDSRIISVFTFLESISFVFGFKTSHINYNQLKPKERE